MSESVWFFQKRVVAILMPRNFMRDELGISILSFSIFISWSYAVFILNLINSVLEKFRNSEMVLNYNFNLLRTSVTLFKYNRGLGFHIITLVSSAKRIREEILFNTRGKSLM
jgi:hypothetical protein